MKNYLQISILSFAGAVCFYFLKMHQFSWGNVEVMKNGSTVNDVWYFISDSISNAFVFSFLAFLFVYLSYKHPECKTIFVLKYLICYGALFAWTRCFFNTITFEIISPIEILVDIILLIFLIYKSIKYRNRHEKSSSRSIGKYHRAA